MKNIALSTIESKGQLRSRSEIRVAFLSYLTIEKTSTGRDFFQKLLTKQNNVGSNI